MTTPTTPSRHLSSLTEDECREAFRIAFGKPVTDYVNHQIQREPFLIEISVTTAEGRLIVITLWDKGKISAGGVTTEKKQYPIPFNALALVDYLREIGIQFE